MPRLLLITLDKIDPLVHPLGADAVVAFPLLFIALQLIHLPALQLDALRERLRLPQLVEERLVVEGEVPLQGGVLLSLGEDGTDQMAQLFVLPNLDGHVGIETLSKRRPEFF